MPVPTPRSGPCRPPVEPRCWESPECSSSRSVALQGRGFWGATGAEHALPPPAMPGLQQRSVSSCPGTPRASRTPAEPRGACLTPSARRAPARPTPAAGSSARRSHSASSCGTRRGPLSGADPLSVGGSEKRKAVWNSLSMFPVAERYRLTELYMSEHAALRKGRELSDFEYVLPFEPRYHWQSTNVAAGVSQWQRKDYRPPPPKQCTHTQWLRDRDRQQRAERAAERRLRGVRDPVEPLTQRCGRRLPWE
eukprot:TRINITY_DN10516_c0_g1_i1.p1 TRINITY_DN10516_c0_g1~~TRINITY_DN10516_c0_g1_i1.p1  ORF type:complete len:251 (+),score=33.86 TRINITY_DN10516_c0_g1_i1:110-862(+)